MTITTIYIVIRHTSWRKIICIFRRGWLATRRDFPGHFGFRHQPHGALVYRRLSYHQARGEKYTWSKWTPREREVWVSPGEVGFFFEFHSGRWVPVRNGFIRVFASSLRAGTAAQIVLPFHWVSGGVDLHREGLWAQRREPGGALRWWKKQAPRENNDKEPKKKIF